MDKSVKYSLCTAAANTADATEDDASEATILEPK